MFEFSYDAYRLFSIVKVLIPMIQIQRTSFFLPAEKFEHAFRTIMLNANWDAFENKHETIIK